MIILVLFLEVIIIIRFFGKKNADQPVLRKFAGIILISLIDSLSKFDRTLALAKSCYF